MASRNVFDQLRDKAREIGVAGLAAIPPKVFSHWERERARRESLGFTCPYWAKMSVNPTAILPSARSVVVGYLTHGLTVPPDPATLFGWIHPYYAVWPESSRRAAEVLAAFLEEQGFRAVAHPGLPEKLALVESGLVRYRRNGVVWLDGPSPAIVPFTLVTEAALAGGEERGTAAEPVLADFCASCRSCPGVCPTSALQAPTLVDPGQCLTYHNEQEGWVPAALRPAMANRLAGCERCQLGCFRGQPLPRPRDPLLYLPDLAKLDEESFHRRNELIGEKYGFRWETRAGLVRAALIGLGCSGRKDVAGLLVDRLDDPSPLIRGHAAWALGNLGAREARGDLERSLARETDDQARRELVEALRWSR